MINRHAVQSLLLTMALASSGQVLANSSQLFPQHDYTGYALPSVGDSRHEVLQNYGQPADRKQGHNGVQLWDYGTFRVVFHHNAVSYAAMW